MSGSSEDDEDTEAGKLILSESTLPGKLHRAIKDRDSKTEDKNDAIPADALAYILKCKSIFKCRICPRVVCLNEDSLKAHLKSKVIRYCVHCFLQRSDPFCGTKKKDPLLPSVLQACIEYDFSSSTKPRFTMGTDKLLILYLQ